MSNSLKRNVIANYASQLYVTIVGLAVVPWYISLLGKEAYGLVGFFSMLQAMFALFDLGLTPTVSRETARFCGGAVSDIEFRRLVRALSIIFAAIAIVCGGGLFYASPLIGTDWLTIEALNLDDVILAVEIMAISVALRWMGGLYRGIIVGFERIARLSGINIALATIRFVLVIPALMAFGATIKVFFVYQLFAAILELLVLLFFAKKLLYTSCPMISKEIGWSLSPVVSKLKFSLGIAFTSSIWVLVTQTDKLLISSLVSLTEYGFFTLSVLIASGIYMLTSSVSVVIRPRLASLYAEGKENEMISLYRKASQYVTVLASSTGFVLAVLAQPILMLWTGDSEVAEGASGPLFYYALGYGLLVIGAFPFLLQFAIGDIKLHVIGSVLFVVVLVPLIFIFVEQFGVVGAGIAWLLTHLLFLTLWVPLVHRTLYPGLHLTWITKDILPPIIVSGLAAYFLGGLFNYDGSKLVILGQVIIVSFVTFTLTMLSSKQIREYIVAKFKVYYAPRT